MIPPAVIDLSATLVCDECFPDILITPLEAGVYEIRAIHSTDCAMPDELLYG